MVEHLLTLGRHRIIGIDVSAEKLAGIEDPYFTFHQEDVRRAPALLDRVIRDSDVVVDLIAYANPSIYVTDPLEVFELNFMQNLEIAKLCILHRKRLIQYSSAEVYGKTSEGGAYNEEATDAVLGPIHKQRWIYATGKMLLERVLYAHGVARNLEFTIIRPFNFIGSRIDYLVPANAIGGPRVFPHFISALMTGGPLRLVDGGHVYRAFMHIADANRAFQAILEQPDLARNQIFNVGNPENNLTIREVASLMIELYGELMGEPPSSQVVDIRGEEFYGVGYEDSSRLPPDVTKLKSLGWAPQHDVRSTFRDAMIHYLRDTAAPTLKSEAQQRRGLVGPHVLRAHPAVGMNGPEQSFAGNELA